METAIERLRASKACYMRRLRAGGWGAGYDWARDRAEWEVLADLSSNRDDLDEETAFDLLKESTHYDDLDWDDALNLLGLKSDQPLPPSAVYCESFLAGALALFDEIKPHLRRDATS
jgi:hypothetical protein